MNRYRIRVVIPNSSDKFLNKQKGERKKCASPDCAVDVVCLRAGPESIESAYDEALAAPYILEEVLRAQEEGFDAVSIDCAMDTVIRAAREAVRIPVTSAGEASRLVAMSLCRRFSVVTVMKISSQSIEERIAASGMQSRVASVRYADIRVLALDDSDAVFSTLHRECEAAIREDGAEAIVLGCTGMSTLTGRLTEALGIPVIDPGAASLRLAELLVRMGLQTSKLAFMMPEGTKPIKA
jgi:allantoin racemase